MTPPKISPADGHAAVQQIIGRVGEAVSRPGFDTPTSSATQPAAAEVATQPARDVLALAVRYLLQRLEAAHPGHTVEVRVPPFGAVQAVDGPRHTRGTPANVVELAPLEWVQLATGSVSWTELVSSGKLSASGIRSDISDLLPLAEW